MIFWIAIIVVHFFKYIYIAQHYYQTPIYLLVLGSRLGADHLGKSKVAAFNRQAPLYSLCCLSITLSVLYTSSITFAKMYVKDSLWGIPYQCSCQCYSKRGDFLSIDLLPCKRTQLWAACVLTGLCLHLSTANGLLVSHLEVEKKLHFVDF